MIINKDIIRKNNLEIETLEVKLKGTTLLIVEAFDAFFMCGALDVNIYNSHTMVDRKVICGKAIGVKTIDELLNSPIYSVCDYGKTVGLTEGMKVYEAFEKLSKEK